MARQIICPNPNCRYFGVADRTGRSSWLVGIFLFFLGVGSVVLAFLAAPSFGCLGCAGFLPLVLYAAFTAGYRYYCPRCGIQVGNDN